MTQSPLGQNPSGSGPFDEAGPGNPDVTPDETTPEQPVGQRSGTPLTETSYPGEPYSDTPTTSSYPQTGYVGTTTSEQSSSGSGGKVGEAKNKAQEVAGTAKQEARSVADTAVSSGKQVAATAQDEARNVVAETKQQAASLLDTVRSEIRQQTSTQQGRIAEAVHGLSKELGSMASSSSESGPLTDLAQQASRKGGEIAHWLQDREPADVLESVRSYARRRPGTFLVLCGLAGVVAGRLTRSAVASRTSLDSGDSGSRGGDRAELGSGYARSNYAAAQPVGYATSEPSYYGTESSESLGGTSQDRSIGVYGGSVESTEPPTAAPYPEDSTLPGSGYVGTTRSLDDPDGDPIR